MTDAASRTIRIAAALIDDGDGRLLLVRKAGSRWFMQAGGKIEGQESALAALRRELAEEIGLALRARDATYLGRFSAPAANEADTIVEAELFHLRVRQVPIVQAEIAEAIWIGIAEAAHLPLAPLTRDVVLALAETL
jgi:8-oxo-dGTP pyrophosphatase MutT (NUDIX family)